MLQALLLLLIIVVLAFLAVMIVNANQEKKVPRRRVDGSQRHLEKQAVFITVSPERLKELNHS